MNGCIFAFAVSGFLTSTKGQCRMNVENSLITTCEGSTETGPAVYIDFYKINRPCTCIVVSLFDGELLVISREEIVHFCNTRVTIEKDIIFGCPLSSVSFSVKINQTVNVHAEYIPPSTSGTFYHCLGLVQNGGPNGNLRVTCGSELAAETTMKTSTTTVLSSTRLLSSSPFDLSVKPTSEINIKNVTKTTAAILSEDRIPDHQFDSTRKCESLVSLQISLAIFVVISILSTILNIYFFFKNKSRNKPGTKNDNKNVIIMNHRGGNERNAETYTELGNMVSGESENQYDSISRQDNYMNTNIF